MWSIFSSVIITATWLGSVPLCFGWVWYSELSWCPSGFIAYIEAVHFWNQFKSIIIFLLEKINKLNDMSAFLRGKSNYIFPTYWSSMSAPCLGTVLSVLLRLNINFITKYRLCSMLITFVTSHGLPALQALMVENKWRLFTCLPFPTCSAQHLWLTFGKSFTLTFWDFLILLKLLVLCWSGM